MKSKLFFAADLDSPDGIERAHEIRACAQGISGRLKRRIARWPIKTSADLPDGRRGVDGFREIAPTTIMSLAVRRWDWIEATHHSTKCGFHEM